jgi:tetratricopeptide (TPR) repeat protein
VAQSVEQLHITAEYQAGIAQLEQKHYPQALEHLNTVIAQRPTQAEALVARARAHLQKKEKSQAIADLQAAYKLAPSATLDLYLGYCYAVNGQHDKAIDHYQQAIDQGLTNQVVYNNLGYSQVHPTVRDHAAAERSLTAAIQSKPTCQAAYINRAFVAMAQGRSHLGEIPSAGLADFQRALEIGPDSGELFYIGGTLYGLAAQSDAQAIPIAIEWFRRAQEKGLPTSELKTQNPCLNSLRSDPAFHALLQIPAGPVHKYSAQRLLDPFTAQAD